MLEAPRVHDVSPIRVFTPLLHHPLYLLHRAPVGLLRVAMTVLIRGSCSDGRLQVESSNGFRREYWEKGKCSAQENGGEEVHRTTWTNVISPEVGIDLHHVV